MKRHIVLLLLVVALACLALASSGTEEEKPVPENPLIGTWKVLSARHGGVVSDLPQRYKILKHVTPTHYTWVWIDRTSSEVVMASGGTYSMTDNTYTENPSFGLGRVFRNNRGKQNTLNWRVEDNKWYHSGPLASGFRIEEVWERVVNEPEPEPAVPVRR